MLLNVLFAYKHSLLGIFFICAPVLENAVKILSLYKINPNRLHKRFEQIRLIFKLFRNQKKKRESKEEVCFELCSHI